MTRECNFDFKQIKEYIDEYNLSETLKNQHYLSSLKTMHKSYFAMICWNVELNSNASNFLVKESKCNQDILLRIFEAVSDMGSAFFNWINGNYKTSRIMLRVAIENFVRAISAIDLKSQLTEKNAYSLFEIASKLSIFCKNESVKELFNRMHTDYKLLCKDTHTSTTQNMQQLSSLASLPKFELEKSNNCSKIFIRVSNNITSVVCLLFNWFFHSMHHRNKENILHSLSKTIRPKILAPLEN